MNFYFTKYFINFLVLLVVSFILMFMVSKLILTISNHIGKTNSVSYAAREKADVISEDDFGPGGLFEGFSPEQEVLEKRSKNSKHFQNADGTFTAQIGRNVHYLDASGKWQNIDLTVANGTSYIGYAFRNETNEIKSYFPTTPGKKAVMMKLEEGTDFTWWGNPALHFTLNNQVIKSMTPNTVRGSAVGKKLIYPEIYTGMSEEFIMLANGMESNTIIHSLSPVIKQLPGTAMLEFEHFVALKNGWQVLADGNTQTKDFNADQLFIRIPGLENGIHFGRIVVFDKNISKGEALLVNMPREKLDADQQRKLDQSVHTVNYKVKFVDNGIKVITRVPAGWLQSSSRAFPVTIDPVVTITPVSAVGIFYTPLSHWYGYQRHANLYLQSEIGAFGSITQIEYNSTDNGTAGSRPTKVFMRTIAADTLSSSEWNSTTYTGDATLCLDENTDQGNTPGWKALSLSTPFNYDQDNLLIMVSDMWGGSGSIKNYNSSSTVTGRQAYNRQDGTDPSDGVSMRIEDRLPEIRITYAPRTTCSGTPSIGTANASSTDICPASPFTLNLSEALEDGLTYQWQSSTDDGNTWTNLGAAQNMPSYTVADQTLATSYQVIVTCTDGGASVTSNTVSVDMSPFIDCNCTPSPSNCKFADEIQNVTFAGINNNSSCSTNGYFDYTKLVPPANVTTGLTYPISVTSGDGGNQAIAVWIDYNQDGIFDISEYTYIGNIPSGMANTTLTIPASALPGITRMRVRSFHVPSGTNDPLTVYTNIPNAACSTVSTGYGETEDYLVTITEGIDCTGTPDAGTISASESSTCTNTPIDLTSDAVGQLGLSYQWQSSTDSGVTWEDLGAPQNRASYTTTQSQASDYRLIVTCTNSSLSDTSSVVSIGQNGIAACYCLPAIDFICTVGDVITNVTFGGINNNTTCGNTVTGYTDYSSSIPPAQVEAGSTVPISVSVGPSGDGWLYESVGVWIDFNQNGVLDALEGEFTNLGTGLNEALTGNIVIPEDALPGTTRMRVVVAASKDMSNAYVCGPLSPTEPYGEMEDYAIIILPPVIDSVLVTTHGGIPAEITTPTGNLQLEAAVYPITSNQDVTWSITPVSGTATISATGLVTAETIGTVWAKAVSMQDNTKSDSLLVTIKPKNITAVANFGNITVQYPTSFDNLGLPAMVEVTYEDETTEEIPIVWDEGNYGASTGSYTLTGTLDVPDDAGNTLGLTASIVVTVVDETAPTVQTRNLIVALDANGQASITPEMIDNDSNDAGGIATLELDKETFGPNDIGLNTVTLTVTDNNGNQGFATATIVVVAFNNSSFVYDGSEKFLAIMGDLPSDVSVSYANNSRRDAGTQTVTATISGGSNYNDLVLTAQLAIAKTNIPDLTDLDNPEGTMGIAFNDKSFVYDGSEKSINLTGDLPEGTSVSYANNSRRDAGTQTATATIHGGNNYNDLVLTAELTITPALRSITFPAIADKTYGDAPFAAGATASTGEAIVYSSSNPSVATVTSNGQITILRTGQVTITATLTENANNSDNPLVTRSFSVGKAMQSISHDNIPAQIQRSTSTLPLSVSASSGLEVSLSLDDEQVATLSGSVLNIHRLGTVQITLSQAGNENYHAAEPVTVTIHVVDPTSNFEVKIHPALSPNGDGINDFLMIEGIRDYPDNKVTLFSRNGLLIYQASGYNNTDIVFSGLGKDGGRLPQGTYFYKVEIKANGQWREQKGYFVLRY